MTTLQPGSLATHISLSAPGDRTNKLTPSASCSSESLLHLDIACSHVRGRYGGDEGANMDRTELDKGVAYLSINARDDGRLGLVET
jgi:hypothetical protein